ncbi:hypothetical protein E2J16_07960 [Campylobacter coli]|nr:hypothetical protein [Campylobacter coli]
MTEIQFNEIKERLSKWRNDRHLTYRKQRNAFLGNVYEEVSEYYRSMNEYEQIDALMDIIVFTANSFDFDYKLNEYEVISITYFTSVLNTLTNIARTLRDYYKEVYKIENSDLDDKEKELELEKIEKGFRPTFQQHAWSIIYEVKGLTENLGFDFYKCMIETIKEIESREQDPEQKKEWEYKIKNKIEIKDKWRKNNHQKEETKYKADYESCRIK